MRLKLVVAVLLSILISGIAYGQEDRGSIAGIVQDSTGAVVRDATVTLLAQETGISQNTVTEESGAYAFRLLIPGLYTVKVSAPGFRQFQIKNVRVEVAGHVGINAKLLVGESSDTVVVSATNVAQLKTEDAVLGFTVESRSATELPSLYGNPFEFQLLSPGVTSTTLSASHVYEGGSESSSSDGSQSGRTEFTLDGAPDTRNGGSVTTAYIPSRDFIGEFRLITSPYDASLAHTSGASLDTSIKAGTSQYHGNATWFYQDPNVDAPQFSQGPSVAPAIMFHRESGTIGGPVPLPALHHKLFFFAGYEHQYNKQAASTTTQTVPTKAEKQGDFSALFAAGKTITSTYTCPATKQVLTATPYNSYQLFDPYTTVPDPQCSGLYVRQPIAGNIITNIDSVAKNILKYYPDPTGSATEQPNGQNNFVSNASNIDRYWDFLTREDYTISERQKLFGHVLISHRIQPGKNLYFPGASGKTNILNNKGAVLDYVNTLSNTSLVNLRYSITRFYTSSTIDAKTTATDLGINANATPAIPAVASGFPYVSVTGYAELGNADPSQEADTTHDAQINYNKSIGRHQLKAGVDWRLYQANQADFTNQKLFVSSTGSYVKGPSSALSASPLGQALAGLELGIAESTKATLNAQTANNTSYWSGFVQDDWKVTSKLVVNMGMRYEFFGPIEERHGKSVTYFDTSVNSPITAQAAANYASTANATELSMLPVSSFSTKGGLRYASPGQGLWTSQKGNFSPRFGFSYNPTTKLVVRGGFGLFYQHIGEYAQYAIANGYAQTTNTVASNDNGQTYVATLANPFPNGLTQPSGNANGLLQSVGSSITWFTPHPKSPYTERFSLGVQYALPQDIMFEADYVGSISRHLRITRDFNAIPDSVLSTDPTHTPAMTALNTTLNASNPNPFLGISVPGAPALMSGSTTTLSQLLKPYPHYTGITASDETGFSNYNGLQITVQKRFTHGYNMSVGYSWSRTLDALTFLNAGDAKPWYGTSNTDYPKVLTIGGIYELPFGRGKLIFGTAPGWADRIIGGFQIEGTYRIQSGQPLSFNSAGTVLKTGQSFKNINGPSIHNYNQWFNTHAFENITDSTNYSNAVALVSNLRTFPLRFNNVRQDYQNALNVGAMKKIAVYQNRVKLSLRAEAFNALNHQVYSNPTTDPSSSSFGKISGPGNQSRQLQFALELNY